MNYEAEEERVLSEIRGILPGGFTADIGFGMDHQERAIQFHGNEKHQRLRFHPASISFFGGENLKIITRTAIERLK